MNIFFDSSLTYDENVRKQLKAPSGSVTYVEPLSNYQPYGVTQNSQLGYNYNNINPQTGKPQTSQTRTSSTKQYSPPSGTNKSGGPTTYQPINSSSSYYKSGTQPAKLNASSTRPSTSSTSGTRPSALSTSGTRPSVITL